MEIKLTSAILLMLLATFELGEALKCYVGQHGVAVVEEECKGSCMTTTTTDASGKKTAVVSCSAISKGDTCEELGGINSCYCNKDLCNKGSATEPTKPPHKKNGTSGIYAHSAIFFIACALGKLISQI